ELVGVAEIDPRARVFRVCVANRLELLRSTAQIAAHDAKDGVLPRRLVVRAPDRGGDRDPRCDGDNAQAQPQDCERMSSSGGYVIISSSVAARVATSTTAPAAPARTVDGALVRCRSSDGKSTSPGSIVAVSIASASSDDRN